MPTYDDTLTVWYKLFTSQLFTYKLTRSKRIYDSTNNNDDNNNNNNNNNNNSNNDKNNNIPVVLIFWFDAQWALAISHVQVKHSS